MVNPLLRAFIPATPSSPSFAHSAGRWNWLGLRHVNGARTSVHLGAYPPLKPNAFRTPLGRKFGEVLYVRQGRTLRRMTSCRDALGIKVDDDLFARWLSWFAPDPQPFLVKRDDPLEILGAPLLEKFDSQLRDTFEVYNLDSDTLWRFIGAAEFRGLPQKSRAQLVRAQCKLGRSLVPSVRSWPSLEVHGIRCQGDGYRFVWWPSLLEGNEEKVLIPYIEDGRRKSRHAEVAAAVWRRTQAILPGARELAGTFPRNSGPNCFGAVMSAAGIVGAAEEWMQREPFESWLAEKTRPGGDDDAPGTVLVWRSPDRLAQHAAITLGDGWALHKPSQGWMSPTKVLAVAEVKSSARARQRHLSRRSLL